MDLLGKASDEVQKKRWSSIVERYYREVDESSFEIFLKDKRKEIEWDCDRVIMEAGSILAQLGDEGAIESLKKIGITGDSKQIQQKIKGKITNHELKQTNKVENKKEAIDFYVLMAKVRKQGYTVNSEVSLIEWVGILKNIQNERSNSEE